MKPVCLFLLVLLSSCSNMSHISGNVIKVSGNQMPSPDLSREKPIGFRTFIYFFEPFKMDQFQVEKGIAFSQIHAKQLVRVETDKHGYFKLKILPGSYSVLIQKDSNYLYSNIKDGEGFINRLSFSKGQKYTIELKADWNATY